MSGYKFKQRFAHFANVCLSPEQIGITALPSDGRETKTMSRLTRCPRMGFEHATTDGADGFPFFVASPQIETRQHSTAAQLYDSYLARRKRKRIGAVVKRRDGDGNGGFMDSRLLDQDKIQIALLFCSVVAIRSSFNRFGDRSVNSFCCRSRSCHFRRGRSRCAAEM